MISLPLEHPERPEHSDFEFTALHVESLFHLGLSPLPGCPYPYGTCMDIRCL